MQDPKDPIPQASRREPWNKGKLIGAKPPLRPKHVWSIRTKLQIAGGPATVRSHGILPANTRWKPRSTTLTIRNSVRLSSSEGVSSRITSKWQSSCSPTARLPACQRGCSPNRLHYTEYANPQRFHLHFCSLCVSKSMRS
jgi:hypothetical protein